MKIQSILLLNIVLLSLSPNIRADDPPKKIVPLPSYREQPPAPPAKTPLTPQSSTSRKTPKIPPVTPQTTDHRTPKQLHTTSSSTSTQAILSPTTSTYSTDSSADLHSTTQPWPPEQYVKTIITTYLKDLTTAYTEMLKDPSSTDTAYSLMRLSPQIGAFSSDAEPNSKIFFCSLNPDICVQNTLFGSYQQFRTCIINTAYYANISDIQDINTCFRLLDLYITKKDSKKSTIERLGTALVWSYLLLDALKSNPELTSIAQSSQHDNDLFSKAIIGLKINIKHYNAEIKKTGLIKKFIINPLNKLYYQNKNRFFAVIRMLSLYNTIYKNDPSFALIKTIRERGLIENQKEFIEKNSTINTIKSREQVNEFNKKLQKEIDQITESIKQKTDLSKISLWKRLATWFSVYQKKEITMLQKRLFDLNEIKKICDNALKTPSTPQRIPFLPRLGPLIAGFSQQRQQSSYPFAARSQRIR